MNDNDIDALLANHKRVARNISNYIMNSQNAMDIFLKSFVNYNDMSLIYIAYFVVKTG